jgi:hypothetical protein
MVPGTVMVCPIKVKTAEKIPNILCLVCSLTLTTDCSLSYSEIYKPNLEQSKDGKSTGLGLSRFYFLLLPSRPDCLLQPRNDCTTAIRLFYLDLGEHNDTYFARNMVTHHWAVDHKED